MIEYSNLKFIERTGGLFEARFLASIDETRSSGILWWAKQETATRKIYAKAARSFRFLDSGDFTPEEVDKMISVHNATCVHEERLEY